MGADLYRKGSEAFVEKSQAAFYEAVRLRNEHMEACGCSIAYEFFPDKVSMCSEVKKLQDKVHEIHDSMYPASHYFRDSYNDSSLLWQLKLSWWGDVSSKLDESESNEREVTQWLLNEVKTRQLPQYNKLEDADYFAEKQVQLIKFLSDALESGDSIRYSL